MMTNRRWISFDHRVAEDFPTAMSSSAPRRAIVLAAVLGAATLLEGAGCSEGSGLRTVSTEYLVTLEQAQSIDYQIAWRSAVPVSLAGEADAIYVFGDYIAATENGRNTVSVVSARDGERLWAAPVGDRLENLMGLASAGSELIASTQSDAYYFEIATGRALDHQRYEPQNAASTPPIAFGPFLLYGTPDGRLVYHHRAVGLFKAAYGFDATLVQAPHRIGENELAVLTATGSVFFMDGVNNSMIWRSRTLDPVVARPAASDEAIFLPGTDQSLWAFRLADGKALWRYRTSQPLRDDPTLVSDVLYQSIPTQGLVAFNVETGQPIWTSDRVAGGTVLTRKNGQLIVWDQHEGRGATGSTFYRILERDGTLLDESTIADLHVAAADRLDDGAIYGLSTTGRMIKMVP